MNRQVDVQDQVRAVYRAAHQTRENSPMLMQILELARQELGLVSTDGSLTDLELEWMAKELGISPSSRVLDIACGSGAVARLIAQQSDCRVIGADLLWRRVEPGQETIRSEGLIERVQLIQADVGQGLSMASGTFNALTLIDALIHFQNQEQLCTEMARVLRPGGHIAIVTVLGTRLTAKQAHVIEETTATLFRLELPDLLALIREAGFEMQALLDRTAQLRRWHQQRYETLQEARAELVEETGEQALAQVLGRAQTTVELLTTHKLTSVILIAEKRR